ncbi:xanthine dehydrogenase accessory protein XdhC [Clostridiaceae bacterium OttesenSCG-928-D20]|nr:xanthine dehydrogenase accessory protein XdhC [Clostridiaceae bacterium OttesenSCG-928-D20]
MNNMPISADKNHVLLRIIASSGSTPREKGAFMLVSEDGAQLGTIGGGAVEFAAVNKALELLKTYKPSEEGQKTQQISYELRENAPSDLGMVCGGEMTVSFELLPRGRGSLEYIESLLEGEKEERGRVFIFGAGHVSKALVPAICAVGFSATVFDDREELLRKDSFPLADSLICGDFNNISEKLEISPKDYAVCLTRGHEFDFAVLSQLLELNPKYIGCIGSQRKVLHINQKLLDRGFSREEIDKIHAPIGIEIFAETPEEIAVSITAQLIMARSDRL